MGPKLRAVFVTLFSFVFIPSLFIVLPGTIRFVLLGFCVAKAFFFVFTTIFKVKLVKVFNSMLPKSWQSLQEILLGRFTKFCKGSCHVTCKM